MEKLDTIEHLVIWVSFIIIGILWIAVVFFVMKFFNKTNDKLEKHDALLASMATDLQSKVISAHIDEVYKWSEDRFREMRTAEIAPIRVDMLKVREDYRRESDEIRRELTDTLQSVKKEIKDDMKTVIDLLRGERRHDAN